MIAPCEIQSAAAAAESGVSILICSYNGAARLAPTLAHLRRQREADHLNWEVLLVDNASSDGTAAVARECWPRDARAPMRIVHERRQGVSHARECGLEAARYEFVSFIDDDNWVCDTWVRRVAELMRAHPEAGAVGGHCEAVTEIAPPAWFARFMNYYAIGPDNQAAGEVTMLWGAGLSLRRSLWRLLRAADFRFLTTLQCEDQELCLALRLAGWKLWFDPDLKLRHFIPAQRLRWEYFRALQRKRTSSQVAIDPYLHALRRPGSKAAPAAGALWTRQVAVTLMNLLQNLLLRPRKSLQRSSPRYEGDDDVLRIENYLGRLDGLLRERRGYARNHRAVAEATWHDHGARA